MPLEELPEEQRTCENCGHTQCAGRGTALHPKWCVFWMEAVGSVETRAEKRIEDLERELAVAARLYSGARPPATVNEVRELFLALAKMECNSTTVDEVR
jgi:hypothetical protein